MEIFGIIIDVFLISSLFIVNVSAISSSCLNCEFALCDRKNYNCTFGCKAGFYGDRCEKICKNCGVTGCNRSNGVCDQCKPGFYGSSCGYICPVNCHKERNSSPDCDRDNGRCLDNCQSGWHGPKCLTPCSEYCINRQCYGDNGVCTHPCERGRYGSHCKSLCGKGCKNGCNRHNGHCIGNCERGSFGPFCNKTCSLHCKKGCVKETGDCIDECESGWYGGGCQSACSKYCQKSYACDPRTGECTSHSDGDSHYRLCKDRFFGKRCDKQCNKCKTCNEDTGICITCLDGFYGDDCSRKCDSNCKEHTCNMNGSCYHTVTINEKYNDTDKMSGCESFVSSNQVLFSLFLSIMLQLLFMKLSLPY